MILNLQILDVMRFLFYESSDEEKIIYGLKKQQKLLKNKVSYLFEY